MGSGKWSPNTYQARVSQRQQQGQDAFAYSMDASQVHRTLNPYGLEVRESRDSTEHPNSNSIIVGLDVTGSMGATVRSIHKNLPRLLGLLLDNTYIPSPQIMFAAFSNGRCDAVPLQVGQFESDNRMDENLENMILGGRLAGGCDALESAELMLYLTARHTSIDCWEKRQRKGFMFIITDEKAYNFVKKDEIKRIFNRDLPANIPIQTIAAEASEKYHVFFVIPAETSSGKDPQVAAFYKSLTDPRYVLVLKNSDDVSEAIAIAIGLIENSITLKDGLSHLRQARADEATINALAQALRPLDGGGIQSSGGLTKPDDDDKHGGSRRL